MNRSISFAACAALALLSLGTTARAELIYGVTEAGNLVNFDSAAPATLNTVGALSGFVGGQSFRGIDFRPATGQLFALGSLGAGAQLYTVNLATAALTPVGSGFSLDSRNEALSIDFNPAVDRLRIVAGDGNNYRANPNTGALVLSDTDLTYNAGSGTGTPFINGIAYSNNVPGGTPTTLYGYDLNGNDLVTIGGVNGTSSPNGGLVFDVGNSNVAFTDSPLGFDISGTTGIGYINAEPATSFRVSPDFYTVDLGTGALSFVGTFNENMLDISAFAPAPLSVPEPGSIALLAGLGMTGMAALRRRRK